MVYYAPNCRKIAFSVTHVRPCVCARKCVSVQFFGSEMTYAPHYVNKSMQLVPVPSAHAPPTPHLTPPASKATLYLKKVGL